MPSRLAMSVVLTAAWLAAQAPTAHGQIISGRAPNTGVNPFGRPVISPYLNLFRGGNPAVNYYGLVRPQQEFANSLQQLQQQAALPTTTPTDAAGALITGHPVQFMNFAPFYNRRIGGGANLAPSGIGPASLAPAGLGAASVGAGRR